MKTVIDSTKQEDKAKWHHNFGLNINNNLILYNIDDSSDTEIVSSIAIEALYHLPWKTKIFNNVINWDIILEYSPSFSYGDTSPLLVGAIQNKFLMKWNFGMNLKLGLANLSEFDSANYIYFASELIYELPLQYKFISTSFFLSPEIMYPISGSDGSSLTYVNTGFRITID